MTTAITTAWQERHQELASFAMRCLVNRVDRYGRYTNNGTITDHELDEAALRQHFAGDTVVGVHSTSPENTCRWLGIDIDNHEGDCDLSAANFEAAVSLLNRLTEFGIGALLEDSNGDGGYHVWVLFAEPVPSKVLYRFGQWLVGSGHETFPKQAELAKGKLGNWLRLPGKHHTREHWSRFWGDGEWLDESESVDVFLAAPLNSIAVLACVPREPDPPMRRNLDFLSNSQPGTSEEKIQDALRYIPADDYDLWVRIGQCLHSEGDHMLQAWETWSRSSEKYRDSDCLEKWQTFSRSGNGVGLGTLFSEAKCRGWDGRPAMSWESQRTTVRQHAESMNADGSPELHRERSFGGVPVVDLWPQALESVEWLVADVISADQPTIFGAKQKSLKTTLLTDLSIALATGYPWLNRFDVPNKQRVLVITGEASERAAIRKIRRAAEHRNIRGEDLGDNIRIETANFPTLPMLDDCMRIQQAVSQHDIDVVILDPLYMGLEGLNTANLTEVGPAMRRFMQHCQPAKVIIAHHVKKSASYDDAPNLEDLSQAGIAEFAGNYWLMGRMSEYQGDGKHDLAIRYGGRDEQFGLLKLEFDERGWTSHFTSLQDHREFQQQQEENNKVVAMRQRILKALGRCPDGLSESKLAEACGTKAVRNIFQTAIEELESANAIEVIPDFKSGSRTCTGFRIKK